jgi:hypothetical protein
MPLVGSSTSKPVTSAPPAAAETRSAVTGVGSDAAGQDGRQVRDAASGESARSVWSSLREAGSELWQRV